MRIFIKALHPIANFENMRYFKKERRFEGVYSKNTLPEKGEETFVINYKGYTKADSLWVALFFKENNVYFDSFGI